MAISAGKLTGFQHFSPFAVKLAFFSRMAILLRCHTLWVKP
jgi:hypothetical protein